MSFANRTTYNQYSKTQRKKYIEDAKQEKRDLLDVDKEIPGQQYVCLSFLSPEKYIKNRFFFQIKYFLRHLVKEFPKKEEKEPDEETQKAREKKRDELILEYNKKINQYKLKYADYPGILHELLFEAKTSHERELELFDHETKYMKQDDLILQLRAYQNELHKLFETGINDKNIYESYETFLVKFKDQLNKRFEEMTDGVTSTRGLKVRGVYSSHAEAKERVKRLQEIDGHRHNVYIGQVGYWLPWDPDPFEMNEQEYANEELNLLMKKYKENMKEQKQHFEKRRPKDKQKITEEQKENLDKTRKLANEISQQLDTTSSTSKSKKKKPKKKKPKVEAEAKSLPNVPIEESPLFTQDTWMENKRSFQEHQQTEIKKHKEKKKKENIQE